MSRKGQSITLSVSERDKAQLEAIASEFGMMWGDRPNISKLVEAIARRQLLIAPNNNWSPDRIRALKRAMDGLVDLGETEQAEILANLLLERGELSLPLRTEIESRLENMRSPLRVEIDRYIHRQQPFQLSYQDAASRLWNFTIHHAKIQLHEKRQYLDCWCEETEGNQDIEALHHNWCLRLDRINDAAITPIATKWRPDLDQIEVEMHLSGGLAFAYKAKSEDIVNNWLPDRQRVRQVVRRVSNTFWFMREVMQYAPDCVVVSPEGVRDRIKQKLINLCRQYDLQIRE
ncbi:MAG TPA: WYL domain-containing protein [Cyanobacteria bacterium UBA11369]|nr:WYL domain-containing protein [Cyanobacteria bacterium UBA11371]HBE33074.1 WYL domain-containing protein [Cyanobacteria bacterium UBA11368]HBE52261.1 WYL domain-containing protein [Cyanobacteria bacterium UBA11369]